MGSSVTPKKEPTKPKPVVGIKTVSVVLHLFSSMVSPHCSFSGWLFKRLSVA